MAALVVFAGIALVSICATVAIAGLLLRVAVRLILLPLFLLKWLVMGVVMLVVGPVLFLVGLVAFVVVGLALAIPVLPILAVGALIWLLVRANRRPALV
jgi:hypothetical protein